MRNSWLIAINTIRELLSKKIIYVLLLVVVFISLGVGSSISFIFEQTDVSDPNALISRKADVLSQVLNIWFSFSILFALVFAAGTIYNDKKSKVIIGLLAKPVRRWNYLLGRWGGVLLFFYTFLLVGVLAVVVLMLLWDMEFSWLFVTGVVYNIGRITVFSGLAFALSLFTPPLAGGGLTFILFSFGNQFEVLMESSKAWITWIGYLLYYLNPSFVKENLLQNGLLNNALDPAFGLYWSVITENFLYAFVLFGIAAYFFRKRDITV